MLPSALPTPHAHGPVSPPAPGAAAGWWVEAEDGGVRFLQEPSSAASPEQAAGVWVYGSPNGTAHTSPSAGAKAKAGGSAASLKKSEDGCIVQ